MSRKTIEPIILSLPLACFALLVLSFLGAFGEAAKNIGWLGSAAGLPAGIIAKARNTNNALAIANISVGTFSLLLMVFLVGAALAFFLIVEKGAEGFVALTDAIKIIG